jgi:endoglycosylceramidase
VNSVYKIPPWHPDTNGTFNPVTSFNKEDVQNIYNWGFTAGSATFPLCGNSFLVRLGVMWPGVEPSKGFYNTTYLKVMANLIEDLGEYGIYTLVDFHQDLLSRLFCGEGIPDWAVAFEHLVLPFPLPSVLDAIEIDPVTHYPNITQCLQVLHISHESILTRPALVSIILFVRCDWRSVPEPVRQLPRHPR